ncbi:hypothetical protein F383_11655 [Gossypium arboreum]|uniref:Uncharacterized protein n=1 Tax=Gossypium arboreum TaxID=29729 RepID=A0A0B0NBT8_GOSAR|nr:hypothetical protein F383_11655 [Gossypium arboreum]
MEYMYFMMLRCLNDKFICILLTKLLKAYFLSVCIVLQIIEATGSSGIIVDHHHTIELYFGTF